MEIRIISENKYSFTQELHETEEEVFKKVKWIVKGKRIKTETDKYGTEYIYDITGAAWMEFPGKEWLTFAHKDANVTIKEIVKIMLEKKTGA